MRSQSLGWGFATAALATANMLSPGAYAQERPAQVEEEAEVVIVQATRSGRWLLCGLFSQSITSRSGSANGNGRSNTELTTLKTAVLAPMARVRVTTALTEIAGDFASMRIP